MIHLNNEDARKYLEEVKTFAKSIGMLEQLEEQLDYLDKYANHNDNGNLPPERHKTRCLLWKDFAPYSFDFLMQIKKKNPIRKHECLYSFCGHRWESSVVLSEDAPACKKRLSQACPLCRNTKFYTKPVEEYERWFNGGLIFHGSHDGGGSGSAPTFSVCLNPTNGWSIHT